MNGLCEGTRVKVTFSEFGPSESCVAVVMDELSFRNDVDKAYDTRILISDRSGSSVSRTSYRTSNGLDYMVQAARTRSMVSSQR